MLFRHFDMEIRFHTGVKKPKHTNPIQGGESENTLFRGMVKFTHPY